MLTAPFEGDRPKFLIDVRVGPKPGERHAGLRVQTLWRDQRQRPQHERVFEDFGAGQNQAVEIADLLVLQKDVDIQR